MSRIDCISLSKIILVTLIFFNGVNLNAGAQRTLQIYVSDQDNDSLHSLITIMETQLRKTGTTIKVESDLSLYKYNGVIITSSDKASRYFKRKPSISKKGPETFSITGDGHCIEISGNSNMALGHAIFSWLESMGYRYYFPNEDWYIIPSDPVILKKINLISSPSFDHRRIWYGYGAGSPKAGEDYNFWVLANKMGGSLNAYFGHAYGNIIARNKDTFLLHPEWFYPVAQKGTIPANPKFDMSREDLVQFIIRDTEREIELSKKNKTNRYKMISLDPSDGPGTCNSPACQQLGTITDRVYYLVNRVTKAIRLKYPDTKIGCLAYSEYINPPTKKVEPGVYVFITTAFNNSSYTTTQLIDEWKKKGANIGIYDYFSWYAWDFDVPGQSIASRPADVEKNIKQYYKAGIRAYDAESSIGWISKGLGYYIASKLFWDINADTKSIRKEFFSLCFKKASGIMEKMWGEWESYSFTIVRENDLARWIDYVKKAGKTESDPAVQRRLFQVKSYLHYLFLYHEYQLSKSEETLLPLLNFGYRKLDDGSVSGYPAFFELGNRSGIKGMAFSNEAKWKINASSVSGLELDYMINNDRGLLKTIEPVQITTFPSEFKKIPPSAAYKDLIKDSANADNAFWMTDEWVFQIKKTGKENYIDFTGDFIGDKTIIKPIRISIYNYSHTGDLSEEKPLITYDYTAHKVEQKINLMGLMPGNYTMIVEDPIKIYRLKFSPAISYSLALRKAMHLKTTTLNYAFIYVPEGTKNFNIIKSRIIQLITPLGRKVDFVNDREEDKQIEVKDGESGLWRIKLLAGNLYVEGIPPFVGLSPYQMLIPADDKGPK